MRPRRQALLLIALAFGCAARASAIEEIDAEESIADLLPQRLSETKESETAETRRWALLPQLGFGPETGFLFGLKFADRNLLDSGINLDVSGIYALEGQQGVSLTLQQPFIDDGNFLASLSFIYRYDPQRDFFGLGNNDQGPEPASTNSFQDLKSYLTVGWRPTPRLALNASIGVRNVHIAAGEQLGSCPPDSPCPFTPIAFPDLPGIDGGTVNPIAFSLVWNTRDDFVRPTHGWRAIAKVIYNPPVLSDFQYTRIIGDLGYVTSFDDEGHYVGGVRIDGEWVAGPDSSIPYWELAELGGDDTMRGFFPHRFVGKGRALLNLEFKFLITEFDFFDLWHIKLDGVVFGDGGRVFLNSEDAEQEFRLNEQIFERIVNNFRYSYGCGVRFALGKALVARIDVGFSDEEKGLVYLAFGQTF